MKLTKNMYFQSRIKRMSSMHIPRNHHHYIVLSILNRWITNIALPHAKGVMLDYGCGGQPYRELFETPISKYIGADVEAALDIDLDLIIDPGLSLAIDSNSIDTVLSTQTLEHVYNFKSYIVECFRVLRPGGYLILTVPMQWRMHEVPFDYWRFTKYGVKSALEEYGFSIINLVPCGGAWALLGQILNSHLDENKYGTKPIYWLINQIALWMGQRHEDSEESIGWMCIAKKSENIEPLTTHPTHM